MKNFKVRCIRNENDGFTKGKVYKVRKCVIIDDDNYKSYVNFENIEELNKFFESKFELVEKEPLKVGDYVVTKKNIKLNNNQLDFSNYMRVEEPLRVVRILYDKYIQLDNNFAYESKWLKKVEQPKETPKVEEYKGFKEDEELFVYEVSYDRIENVTLYLSNKTVKWHIDNGYAFHTKAEAERKKECLDILNQYKQEFSLEDWKNDTIKYTIDTDFNGNNLRTDDWEYLLVSSSGIWFKTQEDAVKVMEQIGYDDWCKYILNLR